jgi:hypothetical protein
MSLLNLEREELDLMIDKGVEFTVKKRSILQFIGSPERKFIIRQPYLGTLDLLSREFLQIEFDEQKLQADGLSESKKLASKASKVLANILAISVLSSSWKIWLFLPLLSKYFLWRVTPSKMLELSLIINYMMNLEGFINSIRLNAVNKTASPPSPIEKTTQED